MSIDVTKYF